LEENIGEKTLSEIADDLGRTRKSVEKKRARMGLKAGGNRGKLTRRGLKRSGRDVWTEEEIRFLKENKEKMTAKEMAGELGRTYRSVTSKIHQLGITNPSSPWSEEEEKILVDMYPEKGADVPLDRPRKAIHQKASEMGIECEKDTTKNLTREVAKRQVEKSREIDRLIPKMKELKEQGLSFREVADELGVSISAVYRRIGGTCPKCDTWDKRKDGWPDEDVKLLREEYPEKGTKIPPLLEKGYTRNAIKRKAQKEGITTKEGLIKGKKKWTEGELELLREHYPDKGTNISQLAHRSKQAIATKANEEGLAGTKAGPIAPLRGERHPFFGKKPSKETMKKMLDIRKPTSPEKRVMEVIESWGFPYRYAGDGQVVIGGLNPDFIDTDGSKKLIEVFGDHWHTGDVPYHRTEEGRRERFSEYGFDLLVLWESEMKELSDVEIAERIRRFGSGQKGA